MKEVNLKLTGEKVLGDVLVLVDDEPVAFKRNEFHNLACNFQTEKDKVNIKIYKPLDIDGFFWFITQIFFFLISVFGILDIYSRNRCIALDYSADFELKEQNSITFRLNPPKENSAAIGVDTDLQTEITSNKFYIDKKAKKIRKALLITKIILAVAIVATVLIVLFVK